MLLVVIIGTSSLSLYGMYEIEFTVLMSALASGLLVLQVNY